MPVLSTVVRSFTFAMLLLTSVTFAVADDKADSKTATNAAEKTVDQYLVPKGDVAKLMSFIDSLLAIEPTTPDAQQEFMQKAPAALLKAAEKVRVLEKDQSSDAYRRATGFSVAMRMRQLPVLDQKARRKIVDDLAQHLTAEKVIQPDVGLAMDLATGLDQVGDSKLAAIAFERFGKSLSKTKDANIKQAALMMAGAARRMNLPGKKLEVLRGTRTDGQPFDWKSYKGKVVLVDFWATWCGPCRQEIPNIKRMYNKYHDQGFDVVGVSLDDNPSVLKSFLKTEEIPWVTLNDAKDQHPMAAHYGTMSIPQAFLVDRTGKVVSTRARGRELENQLTKLFAKGGPK